MYLPVMAADFFLIIVSPIRDGIWISTNAAGIYAMSFRKIMIDTGIFCDISVCIMHRDIRLILFFQCVVECPAHDTHKCSIFKLHAMLDILWQYNSAIMIPFMAGLALCDQIIRGIASCLTAFNMVDV